MTYLPVTVFRSEKAYNQVVENFADGQQVLHPALPLTKTIHVHRMTMNPSQSYRSPGPSGIQTNAVRLRVVLLSFWVVTSFLFLQLPMLPFSMPVADVSSVANVSSEVYAAGFEVQDQESSTCCPEWDCSDSLDCSMPCASSCHAPLVAVLDSLLYRALSSGADIASTLDDNRFVQPTAAALFRPPIV